MFWPKPTVLSFTLLVLFSCYRPERARTASEAFVTVDLPHYSFTQSESVTTTSFKGNGSWNEVMSLEVNAQAGDVLEVTAQNQISINASEAAVISYRITINGSPAGFNVVTHNLKNGGHHVPMSTTAVYKIDAAGQYKIAAEAMATTREPSDALLTVDDSNKKYGKLAVERFYQGVEGGLSLAEFVETRKGLLKDTGRGENICCKSTDEVLYETQMALSLPAQDGDVVRLNGQISAREFSEDEAGHPNRLPTAQDFDGEMISGVLRTSGERPLSPHFVENVLSTHTHIALPLVGFDSAISKGQRNYLFNLKGGFGRSAGVNSSAQYLSALRYSREGKFALVEAGVFGLPSERTLNVKTGDTVTLAALANLSASRSSESLCTLELGASSAPTKRAVRKLGKQYESAYMRADGVIYVSRDNQSVAAKLNCSPGGASVSQGQVFYKIFRKKESKSSEPSDGK